MLPTDDTHHKSWCHTLPRKEDQLSLTYVLNGTPCPHRTHRNSPEYDDIEDNRRDGQNNRDRKRENHDDPQHELSQQQQTPEDRASLERMPEAGRLPECSKRLALLGIVSCQKLLGKVVAKRFRQDQRDKEGKPNSTGHKRFPDEQQLLITAEQDTNDAHDKPYQHHDAEDVQVTLIDNTHHIGKDRAERRYQERNDI